MESKELPVNVEIIDAEITEISGKMHLKVGDVIREIKFGCKVDLVIS